MFEIVFLGTSASIPTVDRNPPATLINHGVDKFLIDMGEGTQRQMKIAGIGLKALRHILLTHHHTDHILGIGGLFFTLFQVPPPHQITVYGNAKTLAGVDLLANMAWGNREERETIIKYYQIPNGNSLLWSNPRLSISAFEVPHGKQQSFGFIFQEKKCHKLLTEKVEALGVPKGPLWGQLKKGQPITLNSGQIIKPAEVLGPSRVGAKFVYIGDCSYSREIVTQAAYADCLVCEATFTSEDEDKATGYGHMTARQAALLAKEANVKLLYLNHRSQRYDDRQVLKDAQNVFPAVKIAKDFDKVTVRTSENK